VNALTLWQRLSLLFAALLLACFGVAAWMQMSQSARQTQRIEQQLSRSLAAHVAVDMAGDAHVDGTHLQAVADRFRATNPGVDLYVLDDLGRVLGRLTAGMPLQRDFVALQPLRDFLAGEPLPILGDDPLHAARHKVFSVALQEQPGRPPGYIYAVLHGSAYDMAEMDGGRSAAAQVALWSIGLVAPLGLVAGLLSFRLVTRPLTELTEEVKESVRTARASLVEEAHLATGVSPRTRDEIAILRRAFLNLAHSNEEHWKRLSQQDQHRREWLANISHDLRTPLASMQGYLETVMLKSAQLSDAERSQYLRAALSESQRLGRLAQELLELARLELGTVKPALETFSLVELAQDVLQKLALSAQSRQQQLVPAFAADELAVRADIGMIERVLTNLLDNAIRHTPPGGRITLTVRPEGEFVRVDVADSGTGIPHSLRPGLFSRAMQRLPSRDGGGLGLAIVQQLLQLHGSDISLQDAAGGGAVFSFLLPAQP
jgi:signal transduction histidine kinase